MTDDDLNAEWLAAMGAATRTYFDELIALDVPRQFLWGGAMKFGIAEIEPEPGGTYQPVDDGKRAVVLPCYPIPPVSDPASFDWTPTDLVAFHPDNPSCWWTRCGSPFLNFEAIDCAEHYRTPLRISSTPLDWLRGGGGGVVVLNRTANLRFAFAGIREIHCDSIALGEAIKRRLREPAVPMPRIRVPAQRRAA